MKRPPKYGNIKTAYDGKVFASRKEAERYKQLKLLEKGGEIEALELQPKFTLYVNGLKIASYVADFQYLDRRTGETITEDVKGMRTPVYKLKKKLVKAIHGVDVVEI